MEDREKVQIHNKFCLTVEEASAYFNIGTKKIRQIVQENDDELSVLNGSKVLIKRKKFEDFLNGAVTI